MKKKLRVLILVLIVLTSFMIIDNTETVNAASSYVTCFNGNGGTSNTSSAIFTSGQQYGSRFNGITANRTGYTFIGWYTAVSGGTRVYASSTVPSKQRTLYAHWTINTCTVKFNANGGNCSTTSRTYTYGTTYGTFPTASRAGYTFAGWRTSGGGTVAPSDKVTSNCELYASWKPIAYTTTFNGNGGTSNVASRQFPYATQYGTNFNDVSASRTGYRFAGWYTAISGGTRIYSYDYVPQGNRTLYAHWTINTYTVKFNANGGSCSTASKTYTHGTAYGTFPTASRAGYTFVGWRTSGGGTVSPSDKVTSNCELHASWKPIAYTTTFNGNGGTSNVASRQFPYATQYGTNFNDVSASRTGYRFAGWYTEASGGTRIYSYDYVPQGNRTLYAHWEVNEYTLTFNANGGSCSVASKSYNYGSKYTSLPQATRVGYKFAGWFTYDGKEIVSGATSVSASNYTVYAHWIINTYTVTFNANGGECSTANKTYVYGAEYGTLPVARRTGYTFDGWRTNSGGIVSVSDKVTSNCELHVNWKPITYTTVFMWNDGTSKLKSMGFPYSTQYGNSFNEMSASRVGYRFAGWYTEAQEGIRIYSYDYVPYGNRILYAHWEINTYIVSFDCAGGRLGVIESVNIPYTYGKEFGNNMPSPKRTGYTFDGWYTSDGKKISPTDIVTKDYELHARWKPIAYTTIFDGNGGTSSIASTMFPYGHQYGSGFSEIYAVREGYTFLGWYTAATGGTEVLSSDYVPNENHTLYAHWKIKTYTIELDFNGGTYNGQESISLSYIYGQEFGTLPTPTKSGYKINGWYWSNRRISSSDIVTDNCKLVVNWNPEAYTTYFNGNGGTSSTISDRFRYNTQYGYRFSQIYAVREGYTFLGWYTELLGGDEVLSSDYVYQGNRTLYAHWKINMYTVKFNANGGECGVTERVYGYNTSYASLPKAVKTGYIFDGWYTSNGKKVLESDKITSDCELYAHWRVEESNNPYANVKLYANNYGTFRYEIGDGETLGYKGIDDAGVPTIVYLTLENYNGNVKVESNKDWVKCNNIEFDSKSGLLIIPLDYNKGYYRRTASIKIILDKGIYKEFSVSQEISNSSIGDIVYGERTLGSYFEEAENGICDDLDGLFKCKHCGYVRITGNKVLFYETVLGSGNYCTQYIILEFSSMLETDADLNAKIDRVHNVDGVMCVSINDINKYAKDPKVYVDFITENTSGCDILASAALYSDYNIEVRNGKLIEAPKKIYKMGVDVSKIIAMPDPINFISTSFDLFDTVKWMSKTDCEKQNFDFTGYGNCFITDDGIPSDNIKTGERFYVENALTKISNSNAVVFSYKAPKANSNEENNLLAKVDEDCTNAIAMLSVMKICLQDEFVVYYDYVTDSVGFIREGDDAPTSCGYYYYTRKKQNQLNN